MSLNSTKKSLLKPKREKLNNNMKNRRIFTDKTMTEPATMI
jgi:hypothetical protein